MAGSQQVSATVDEYNVPSASELSPDLLVPIQVPEVLQSFADEYRKLQQALSKSHESEQRFVRKCRDLVKNIHASSEKIIQLTRQHEDDVKQQRTLLETVEENKRQISEAQADIGQKKKAIAEMRSESAQLDKRMEESEKNLEVETREHVFALRAELDQYTQNRDLDRNVLTKIRNNNLELARQYDSAWQQQLRVEKEVSDVESKVNEVKSVLKQEDWKKQELNRQMKDLQSIVNDRSNQVAVKKDLIAKAEVDLQTLNGQLDTAKAIVEEHSTRYDELSEMAQQLDSKLVEMQEENELNARQLMKQNKNLADETTELVEAQKESQDKKKRMAVLRKRVRSMEEQVRRADETKDKLQSHVMVYRERKTHMQHKLKINTKQMDTCVREREVLSQSYVSKIDSVKRKDAALRISKSVLKNIKNEYQGLLVSIRQLSKLTDMLRRDKAAHEQDLTRRQLQKAKAEEEALERDNRINGLQRQIFENETKLRQQQNMLEAVRSDRNFYSQTLLEQKSETVNYKRKFHRLTAQIRQIKQDISEKDIAFVTEHIYLDHVKADIVLLNGQNEICKKQIAELDEVIRDQGQQVLKLAAVIASADEELKMEQKQYDAIVNEQKVLNQQLIKRNEELATLYEKLKLQTSVMKKSELHYRDRISTLRSMATEKQQLIQQLQDMLHDQDDYSELKQTIVRMEGELIEQQRKVKALSEELTKSINIHRWRQLMDTNTDTFSMLKKAQALQKAIISKTTQVEEKEKMIQEREKLYIELRKVLSRQPGGEVAEQLRVYEITLKEKKSKYKMLKGELRSYQSRVDEYKYDISRLKEQLQVVKLEYFARMRRKSQQNDTNQWFEENQLQSASHSPRLQNDHHHHQDSTADPYSGFGDVVLQGHHTGAVNPVAPSSRSLPETTSAHAWPSSRRDDVGASNESEYTDAGVAGKDDGLAFKHELGLNQITDGDNYKKSARKDVRVPQPGTVETLGTEAATDSDFTEAFQNMRTTAANVSRLSSASAASSVRPISTDVEV